MRLKLMPDYQCAPLWWDNEPGLVGDVIPEDLDLPPELCDALWAWADRFDATLNQDDPAASGFESAEEHAAFVADGEHLAECVRVALGPDHTVRYLPPEA
jgi:hypothetical protein